MISNILGGRKMIPVVEKMEVFPVAGHDLSLIHISLRNPGIPSAEIYPGSSGKADPCDGYPNPSAYCDQMCIRDRSCTWDISWKRFRAKMFQEMQNIHIPKHLSEHSSLFIWIQPKRLKALKAKHQVRSMYR